MKIGVLAVQGDFAEHISVLRRLDVDCYEVRLPEHLEGMDGLIIPGGESTTLSRLMSIYHLREPVRAMAERGKAIWGTCAGMIMLAQEITEADPVPLQLMNIGVQRNAFGRQIDSFEQDLDIAGLDAIAGLDGRCRTGIGTRTLPCNFHPRPGGNLGGATGDDPGLFTRARRQGGGGGSAAGQPDGNFLSSRTNRRCPAPPLFSGPGFPIRHGNPSRD